MMSTQLLPPAKLSGPAQRFVWLTANPPCDELHFRVFPSFVHSVRNFEPACCFAFPAFLTSLKHTDHS